MSLTNNSSNLNILEPFAFRHPFTCMIAGPTQSGKTTLLKKIISQCDNGLLEPPPNEIVYCFSRWQEAYDDIKMSRAKLAHFNLSSNAPINFIQGLPDFDNFDSTKRTLLILDDLMSQCGKDSRILDIFTTDSHHRNISVIFVTQNIFSQEKNCRTISLNSQYIILTNNPRDRLQLIILAKQMFPGSTQFFTEAYKDAVTCKDYGYLLMDFTQQTHEENRIQTGIFENEDRIIYRKK